MAEEARTQEQVTDAIADKIFGAEEEAPQEPEKQAAPVQEDEPEWVDPAEEKPEVKAEEDGDVPDETEDEPVVEIEVDGELLEVPARFKDHFLRQQDYTQKTQEVAAERKAVEVRMAEVEQVRQQYDFAQEVQPDLVKIDQLKAQVDQARQYMRDNLDNLTSTDIEKWRLAIDDAERERNELVQGLQSKTQAFQQAQEQSRQELLKKGTEVLRSRIPSWGESDAKAVREYALASGFTEQEVETVVDPRYMETLWKAAQYDRLQQGKTAAVKRVQAAPTIKAKARNPMPKATQRMLNTRKKLKSPNLSAKDKAKVIQDNIADRLGL